MYTVHCTGNGTHSLGAAQIGLAPGTCRKLSYSSCLPRSLEHRRDANAPSLYDYLPTTGRHQTALQAADSRLKTADSRLKTADSRQQTALQSADRSKKTPDTRQQTPDTRQQTAMQAADNRQKKEDTRKQTALPAADRKQKTEDSRQQIADRRLKTAESRQKQADRRQQTASFRWVAQKKCKFGSHRLTPGIFWNNTKIFKLLLPII